MTQAQHKARLRRVIKEWRSRLMMDHVEFAIEWNEQPEDPDAAASISCSDYYDYAVLRFADGWEDHNDEELNRIVVHELLHMLFRDYGNAIRSVEAGGMLSTDVRLMWHDRCNAEEERLIDRVAHRLIEQGGTVT